MCLALPTYLDGAKAPTRGVCLPWASHMKARQYNTQGCSIKAPLWLKPEGATRGNSQCQDLKLVRDVITLTTDSSLRKAAMPQ